jgi:hypothetical protein
MLHVLYRGDVHPGEATERSNVADCKVARVKLESGGYAVVMYDSAEALEKFLDADAEQCKLVNHAR